jgi:hypothetical protein
VIKTAIEEILRGGRARFPGFLRVACSVRG